VFVRPAQVLHCLRCGMPLSRPVRVIAARDASPPAMRIGEAPTPPGEAYRSHAPLHRRMNGRARWPLETAPQVWMRLDDLLETVAVTRDALRATGCCGLDGCDGPNRVCACGAYVGTEQSDCWTPRVFVPDPAATRWAEAEP
jgi:hypothetical protein